MLPANHYAFFSHRWEVFKENTPYDDLCHTVRFACLCKPFWFGINLVFILKSFNVAFRLSHNSLVYLCSFVLYCNILLVITLLSLV